MIEIYRKVASALIKTYDGISPLRLPKYHNNDVKEFRVSEQESKTIFSHIFFTENIPFSIEVPTISKHNFSGKSSKSARFDMSIYDKETKEIKYAIELKAHNPVLEHIRRDIEKFACSDLDCIWFHTLENANKKTYETLLNKFKVTIQSENNKIKGKHLWDFVIVVLKQKEMYYYQLEISQDSAFQFGTINDFTKELV
ncbi:MAG: hypothetical protein Ta2F_12570 [Termitinemataceae bacterium]|nr:MAG: hypothetical protein Ta2F_12570 [Termitinemataceae bacterium]